MRLTAYLTLTLTLALSLILAATVALVSSCASVPAQTPAADISGDWYGTAEVRGLQQPIVLHLERGVDGEYSGTADEPGEVEFGLALKSVAVDGAHVQMEIASDDAESTISGTLDPASHRIDAEFGQDGATIPLSLRPVDASVPAFGHPQSLFYDVDGRRIHYVRMDGPPDVRVVFIHGTPGAWQGWSEYLGSAELQRRATLIAVDRPGFGESGGEVVPDLREQARLLEPLLRGPDSSAGEPAERPSKTIVVGHSLGGPIAAELAMDFPQEVQGALLIAPSIDPATEQPRWYNEAMTWWAVSELVSKLMDPTLKNANLELMPLDAQLKLMEPRWRSLQMPVTVIQGEKDEIVDPRTADFARRVLPPGDQVIRVPDEGHFVLWEKPKIEVEALTALLNGDAVASGAPPRTVR